MTVPIRIEPAEGQTSPQPSNPHMLMKATKTVDADQLEYASRDGWVVVGPPFQHQRLTILPAPAGTAYPYTGGGAPGALPSVVLTVSMFLVERDDDSPLAAAIAKAEKTENARALAEQALHQAEYKVRESDRDLAAARIDLQHLTTSVKVYEAGERRAKLAAEEALDQLNTITKALGSERLKAILGDQP